MSIYSKERFEKSIPRKKNLWYDDMQDFYVNLNFAKNAAEGGKRMKKWISVVLLTASMLLLSGCIFRTPDELYQLPQRSPGYGELTKKIEYVKRSLEMEFGTVVEPAVIYSGVNTSNIQLQDLDSDGEPETAVTFLRVPGAELPLRICCFTIQPDGSYELSCMVEGTGSAIYSVDFADLSGSGIKELVVSWQASTNVHRLGVYSLKNDDGKLSQEGGEQGTVAVRHYPEATELMSTTYSGYSLLDIDQDTRTELAVIRLDSAGANSQVELYGWENGGFSSLGAVRLSTGITALTRVRSNFVADGYSALYVTGSLMDGGQSTDIVAWRGDKLVNLTMNRETGVSSETIWGYNISPSDVNNDTVLELPCPKLLPSYQEGVSNNFWLIDWSQYSLNGRSKRVFTTYHNIIDNWYFEVPDFWVGQITIARNDSVSGERGVVFSHWNGQDQEPTPFLVIYKLTGVNRTIRAAQGGRFILAEDDSTIYAASLLASKWDCGLDETGVRDRFRRTSAGWNE